MTPAVLISRLDAAIAGYGQTVRLERTAADPATGAITVTQQIEAPAFVRSTAPQDLLSQAIPAIRVVLSPTNLGSFGIPSRDDRITIDGNPSNIEEIGPLYYGGQLVRVNLLARG